MVEIFLQFLYIVKCFCVGIQGDFLVHSKYVAYGIVITVKSLIVGNKIVDHSDVVGALPVGAAPTTSSFST